MFSREHNEDEDKQPTCANHLANEVILYNKKCGTAGCASILNFERKSDELIYIKIGETDHPAFELENPANPGENDTLWVEWVTTGKKACVFRYQVVKDGLRARKRHRPKYFSEYLA